jgi:hypothetical protein
VTRPTSWLASITLLFGACASGPSPEAISAAKARGYEPGEIGPGDSADYVRLQWGPPSGTHRLLYAEGSAEKWVYCYYDQDYQPVCPSKVLFINGTVTAVETTCLPDFVTGRICN